MRLTKVIDDHLRMERKTRTQFAEELGVSKNVMSRFLRGQPVHGNTFSKVMIWLLEQDEDDMEEDTDDRA